MRSRALLLLATIPAIVMAIPAWSSTFLMPAAQLKRVSSGFGPRSDGFHPGVDLSAPFGSPVRAAAAGTVVFAGRYAGYGNMVDVRGRDGVVTRYAHLSAINARVRPGRSVTAGQPIGAVGMTGNTSGAHLHFEVRVGGRLTDPARFLAGGLEKAAPRARARLAQSSAVIPTRR
ncbi:M23 family metallopeptidase [Sphingomonas sp.]|uniref:M23 family metallopeptidase n=1 Tax=Sphingomonas sp. TaxID=28214 RepID=UPI0035B12031